MQILLLCEILIIVQLINTGFTGRLLIYGIQAWTRDAGVDEEFKWLFL